MPEAATLRMPLLLLAATANAAKQSALRTQLSERLRHASDIVHGRTFNLNMDEDDEKDVVFIACVCVLSTKKEEKQKDQKKKDKKRKEK